MAWLAVGEALTNLVWAKVTSHSDVMANGNWIYATKMDGEGAAIERGMKKRYEPLWYFSFTPTLTNEKYLKASLKPKVAVIREEGSNGERKMAAGFHAAGFEP
ncbi:hypothetical protein LIER_42429 [Lithospermum erythrorhizon]|uniref:FGAR-AT PurM N-terminal-like domain-containing protein n=1 Tax=Lithospermum erythrorhizon TaxID=34254 RepID=A0AAV3RT40_LITER